MPVASALSLAAVLVTTPQALLDSDRISDRDCAGRSAQGAPQAHLAHVRAAPGRAHAGQDAGESSDHEDGDELAGGGGEAGEGSGGVGGGDQGPAEEEPDGEAADGPEDQALVAESIGLALLIVLESLTPPERLAFVLHDIFAVQFDNIGQVMGRTPEAARQLASRARRRVQAAPQPDPDLPAQHRAVDAFLAAARHGDFAGLLELLAPDVVLRFEPEPGTNTEMPPASLPSL